MNGVVHDPQTVDGRDLRTERVGRCSMDACGLEAVLDLPFQFIVQHHASHASARRRDPGGFRVIHAIEGRIVRHFPRLHEPVVDRLAVRRGLARDGRALAGQAHDRESRAAVAGDRVPPHQSLRGQGPQVLTRRRSIAAI